MGEASFGRYTSGPARICKKSHTNREKDVQGLLCSELLLRPNKQLAISVKYSTFAAAAAWQDGSKADGDCAKVRRLWVLRHECVWPHFAVMYFTD